LSRAGRHDGQGRAGVTLPGPREPGRCAGQPPAEQSPSTGL